MARRAGVRVRDVALMPFTSGTTADPKGCLLTHESLFRVWVSAARPPARDAEDRVFDPLPLFHMSCLGPLIFSFHLGATLISMTHFEPGRGARHDRGRAGELALHGLPADHDGPDHAPDVR